MYFFAVNVLETENVFSKNRPIIQIVQSTNADESDISDSTTTPSTARPLKRKRSSKDQTNAKRRLIRECETGVSAERSPELQKKFDEFESGRGTAITVC